MKSSGIRRGLAVAAVGALAAVAVPISAHANSIDQQMDNAWTNKHVTLYGPHPGANQISTKADGFNSTVTLEAGGTSDIDTMRFQYSTDGGVNWFNIGGVLGAPNDDGAWTMEWNPLGDSGIALGTTLLVRANGHSTLDGLSHPGTGVPVTFTNTFDTIGIAGGSQLGVWKSNAGPDNVILSGKASYNGTGTIGVAEPVSGTRIGLANFPIAGNAWNLVYDIEGPYTTPNFGYNAPDQIVMSATTDTVNPTSSDTESYTLYDQVITTITATANPANPPNNNPVPTTVTVKDQNGKPIAGVNVSSGPNGGPYAALGVTDANGQVTTTQSIPDGDVRYIANVATGDQLNDNSAIGDKSTVLTLGQAFAADLAGKSNDGAAFDFDEQDGDDVQVQVKDQTAGNFDVQSATQDLTYFWKKIPFDAGDEPETGTSHVVTTETNGLFDIPVLDPADFAHGLVPGSYELYASLSEGGTGHSVATKKVLTVKAGEAAVQYSVARTQAPTGTTATVNGKLVLEDGTGLVNRRVHLDVFPGQEYDENGFTGAGDAILSSNANVTTTAGGAFSAQVEDLSTDPSEVELNVLLQASALPATGPSPDGNWIGDPTFFFNHFLDFTTNQVPDGSVLDVNDNNTTAGPAGDLEGGSVHLEDGFGDDLAGVQVQLTLDHGFFTDGYKAPASGDYNPTPNSLGSTITVVTNAAGNANFQTSIGRDSGFDDDNHVIAKVTGTVDGVNDNDTLDWNAANPLNVSEVSVVRTPGEPEVASTNDVVRYDVFAKDQFGNPVRGVQVSIDCTQELGDDDLCPTFAPIVTQSDLDNGGDALLVSDEGGTFEYEATVTTPNTDVYDASLVSQVVERSTTFQQEWYEPSSDPDDGATYDIEADPGTQDVPTDTPVTVTVTALDQEGNPLTGLEVNFVRTSDADNDQTFNTDANGVAQYVFQGTDDQCGRQDTVTAVVRDGGTIVNQLNITIHFEKCHVEGALTGRSSRDGKHDILKVSATTPDGGSALTGTPVMLMAKIGGEWVQVGQSGLVLDSNGKAKITVRDRNGEDVTKYKAMIDEHGRNAAAVTNKARVR